MFESFRKRANTEIAYFRKKRVYDKVSRSMPKGHSTVGTHWIDTSEGDHDNLDYRSRLAAIEFNEYSEPSLFAATPPLEAMRYIIHSATTRRPTETRHCVMTVDVSRAYFNAVSTRDVFGEIPK